MSNEQPTRDELLRATVAMRHELEELRGARKRAWERMEKHRKAEGIASHSMNTHAEVAVLLQENEALRERARQFDAMAYLLAQDIAYARMGDDGSPCFDILCSDTFAYACADGEALAMECAPEVMGIYATGGYYAVAEWVQKQRGGPEKSPFITPVRDAIEREREAKK